MSTASQSSCPRRASSSPSAGHLALRIGSPPRTGQIVRLAARKILVGSAPHCQLRLRAPGVLPVHCLLLRGPQGLFARCLARDTRHNGWPFQDALLNDGDCLSIGPIELEIVEGGTPLVEGGSLSADPLPPPATAPSPSPAEPRRNPQRRTARYVKRLWRQVQQIGQDHGELKTQLEASLRRETQLVAQIQTLADRLGDCQVQLDQLCTAHPQLPPSPAGDAPHDGTAAITNGSEIPDVVEDIGTSDAALDQNQSAEPIVASQTDGTLAEGTQLQEADPLAPGATSDVDTDSTEGPHDQEPADPPAEHPHQDEPDNALAATLANIERLLHIDETEEAHDLAGGGQLAADHETVAGNHPDSRAADHDQLSSEDDPILPAHSLLGDQFELEQQRADWGEDPSAMDGQSVPAPAQAEDELNAYQLENYDAGWPAPDPSPRDATDERETRAREQVEASNEPEDTISAYMGRLMQRIGGSWAPPADEPSSTPESARLGPPKEQATSVDVDQAAQESTESAPASLDTPSSPTADDQEIPDELPRRRIRPADGMPSMEALRDVANLSARTAINRHWTRQRTQMAASRTFVAILTTMIGGTFAFWADNWRSPAAWLAGLSFVIAGGCLINGIQHYLVAQRSRKSDAVDAVE